MRDIAQNLKKLKIQDKWSNITFIPLLHFLDQFWRVIWKLEFLERFRKKHVEERQKWGSLS